MLVQYLQYCFTIDQRVNISKQELLTNKILNRLKSWKLKILNKLTNLIV